MPLRPAPGARPSWTPAFWLVLLVLVGSLLTVAGTPGSSARPSGLASAPVAASPLASSLLTARTSPLVAQRLASHALKESTGRYDKRISTRTCTLLGRAWDRKRGCSRFDCLNPRNYAKSARNAETCRVGGRKGPGFGEEVDFRRCLALHREWVRVLNLCISNPYRGVKVIPHAPQCSGRYSTYVTLAEVEGRYDQCLMPGRVRALQKIAARTHRSLAYVAADRSELQCSYRAQHVFRGGRCIEQSGPVADDDSIVVVGDSITWRATNELAHLHPTWDIDGSTGRQIGEFGDRIAHFERAHGLPAGVIFALGANPSRRFSVSQLRADLARLPASTPVMFVVPYLTGRNGAGRINAVARYASQMSTVAGERPGTCLADWRGAVRRQPSLLVDGVHQTTRGEVVWADLISSSWARCVSS